MKKHDNNDYIKHLEEDIDIGYGSSSSSEDVIMAMSSSTAAVQNNSSSRRGGHNNDDNNTKERNDDEKSTISAHQFPPIHASSSMLLTTTTPTSSTTPFGSLGSALGTGTSSSSSLKSSTAPSSSLLDGGDAGDGERGEGDEDDIMQQQHSTSTGSSRGMRPFHRQQHVANGYDPQLPLSSSRQHRNPLLRHMELELEQEHDHDVESLKTERLYPSTITGIDTRRDDGIHNNWFKTRGHGGTGGEKGENDDHTEGGDADVGDRDSSSAATPHTTSSTGGGRSRLEGGLRSRFLGTMIPTTTHPHMQAYQELTESFPTTSSSSSSLTPSPLDIEQHVHKALIRWAIYIGILTLCISIAQLVYQHVPSYITICRSVLGFSPAFCLYGHIPSRMLWPPPQPIVIPPALLAQFTGGTKKMPDTGQMVAVPIFISILGQVFDVTKGAEHYAPGAPYHFLVGKDASRAFATGDFSKSGLNPKIDDLSYSEVYAAHEWLRFYYESEKYSFIGVLDDYYYSSSGSPKSAAYRVERMLRLDALEKERSLQLEGIPNCEIIWSPGKGALMGCPNGRKLMIKRRLRQLAAARKGLVVPPYASIEEEEYQRVARTASPSPSPASSTPSASSSPTDSSPSRRSFPRDTDHVVSEGRRIRNSKSSSASSPPSPSSPSPTFPSSQDQHTTSSKLNKGSLLTNKPPQPRRSIPTEGGVQFPMGRNQKRYVVPDLILPAPRYPRRLQYTTSSLGTGLPSYAQAWNERCACLTEHQLNSLPRLVERGAVTEQGVALVDKEAQSATLSGWIKTIPIGMGFELPQGYNGKIQEGQEIEGLEDLQDENNDYEYEWIDDNGNEEEGFDEVEDDALEEQYNKEENAEEAILNVEPVQKGLFARVLSIFGLFKGSSTAIEATPKSLNKQHPPHISQHSPHLPLHFTMRYAEYPNCNSTSTTCLQSSWSSNNLKYHKQASPHQRQFANEAMNRIGEQSLRNPTRTDPETMQIREELRQERVQKEAQRRAEALRKSRAEPYADHIGSWRTQGILKQLDEMGEKDAKAKQQGHAQQPDSGNRRFKIQGKDTYLKPLHNQDGGVKVSKSVTAATTQPVNPWGN